MKKVKKYETDVLLDEIKKVYETHYIRCESKAVHDLYNAIFKRIRKHGHTDESGEQTRNIDIKKVIRCRNCKFSRELDRTKSPEKYFNSNCIVCECEDVVGDEPMIYLDSHYCSFGKINF